MHKSHTKNLLTESFYNGILTANRYKDHCFFLYVLYKKKSSDQ